MYANRMNNDSNVYIVTHAALLGEKNSGSVVNINYTQTLKECQDKIGHSMHV